MQYIVENWDAIIAILNSVALLILGKAVKQGRQ